MSVVGQFNITGSFKIISRGLVAVGIDTTRWALEGVRSPLRYRLNKFLYCATLWKEINLISIQSWIN